MKHILLLVLSLFLCQCISTRVAPVAAGHSIQKVQVVKNDKVHMSGMLPEIIKQLGEMGIQAEAVDAPPASPEQYYMTFTANWHWDMALYLSYFQVTLHQGSSKVGSAEYDAKNAGLHLGKFGDTHTKMRPVLLRLFGRPVPPAPVKERKIQPPRS